MMQMLNTILNIYFAILIIYIFATWIPNVNWKAHPWLALEKVANLYLGIFEKIIPGWGCIVGLVIFKFLQEYFLSKY